MRVRSRFAPWPALLVLAACDPDEPKPSAQPSASVAEPAPPDLAAPDPVPAPAAVAEPIPTVGDARPRPPEDYGVLRPPLPPPEEEALTHLALVGYEVVAVYGQPDAEAARLGYLRLGTRSKVTAKVEGPGCPQGWYGLPQGGFACASKGLVVEAERPPFMKYPPPSPRLEGTLPYDYGYVRRFNSPMWWRVPMAEELARAEVERSTRETERLALLPPTTTTPAAAPAGTTPTPGAAALPSLAPTAPAAAPAAAPVPEPAPTPPVDPPAAAEPAAPPPPLPLNPEKPWLEKGFFVSLGEIVREGGRAWWRTARGAYVAASDVHRFGAKDFRGIEIADDGGFPVGFVMQKGAKLHELGPDDKVRVGKEIEMRTGFVLDQEVEIRGTTYMTTKDGALIKKSALRMPDPQPLPQGLEPWDRWIDVSLDKQMLVAYEGSRPVYVTLISTGKKGTEEEPFETPPGRYRIQSKHVSTTMAGLTASDGNYSIQDVPWTMFFEGSYALHGAFWHRNFGYVRSHGCVNLGPSDARWLFHFTTPQLPIGWHGVNADDRNPGTTIVVRP